MFAGQSPAESCFLCLTLDPNRFETPTIIPVVLGVECGARHGCERLVQWRSPWGS